MDRAVTGAMIGKLVVVQRVSSGQLLAASIVRSQPGVRRLCATDPERSWSLRAVSMLLVAALALGAAYVRGAMEGESARTSACVAKVAG